jgi:hypothetical protein
MSAAEQVTDSLIKIADLELDLTQTIYKEYFARCPAADALMGYSDPHMRGRMLEQTFGLIMDPSLQGEDQYFRWEIGNHLMGYGVNKDMYVDYLESIRDCVKAALQDAWQPQHESGWQLRIQSLLDELALLN